MNTTPIDRDQHPRKAVILSAGQGRRLLPLTASEPKCLLTIGGRSVLDWQLEQLAAGGFRQVVVVVGFGDERVRASLERRSRPVQVRTLYNPFYRVSDNLVSAWVARREMTGSFLLVNGDTLFETRVLERVLESQPAPATMAIDHKPAYDADDMKVECAGNRLVAVGKDLPAARTHGESIGMILFRGEGTTVFRSLLESAVRDPSRQNAWYLSIVDRMAKLDLVRTVSIDPLEWTEIDYPHDLEHAAALVAGWQDPCFPPIARAAG